MKTHNEDSETTLRRRCEAALFDHRPHIRLCPSVQCVVIHSLGHVTSQGRKISVQSQDVVIKFAVPCKGYSDVSSVCRSPLIARLEESFKGKGGQPIAGVRRESKRKLRPFARTPHGFANKASV